MSKKSPRVLLFAKVAEIYSRPIAERFPRARIVACQAYDELAEMLRRNQPEIALVNKFEKKPFPRDALFAAPSLRWVQCGGAGVDHLVPWDARRVTVTNASGIHVDILAEYALCAILMFSLKFPVFARQQRQHHWQNYDLPSVRGKTLVVVGFGKIGRGLAARAKALGMRVIGLRTKAGASPHAAKVLAIGRLKEAVAVADFLALTLPLTARTRNLIDAAVIAAVKPGARLINISRGGVVDEAALIRALRAGQISEAAIDVFADEPLAADSEFWDLPNVFLTPHTGDPENWESTVADLFCDNLDRWMQGKKMKNIVLPDRGY